MLVSRLSLNLEQPSASFVSRDVVLWVEAASCPCFGPGGASSPLDSGCDPGFGRGDALPALGSASGLPSGGLLGSPELRAVPSLCCWSLFPAVKRSGVLLLVQRVPLL